ncbi:MAG: NAD(P)-dependent alcohol dehydrogenase [Candidatus Dormibacteria bacterium]
MKAAISERYGPPEVVHIGSVAIPPPHDGDLLIHVRAASVNRSDTAFRAGHPRLARAATGLRKPRWRILGTEFSGEVVATAHGATGFALGDPVYGINPWRFGAHATFIRVPARGTVAHKPERLTFEQAAAVCDGGLLALMNLRSAHVAAGQKVVIYGASGSIGTAGVQLAKEMGAHVVAVTAPEHAELVRSLGADEVIDYTSTDFTENHDAYDVIFDAVGKLTFARCSAALQRGGVFVPTDGARNMLLALSHAPVGGRRAVMVLPPRYRKEDVMYLSELINAGRYRPVIDRSYALDDIVEAHRYVDTGQKVGNVVIQVAAEPLPASLRPSI